MMSKGDKVAFIRECNCANTFVACCFCLCRHREYRFEDFGESLTERGGEVMENEMWVRLWSSSELGIVMTEGDVVQGEEGGGTVREM
jgi:hypothetical protein